MGLYNFKSRFEAPILDGTKKHTIRAKRTRPDKPGDTLHLYVGLRHAGARCLMRPTCTAVRDIEIEILPEIFLGYAGPVIRIDGEAISLDECECLARADGFNDFAEMMSFWDGQLPFKGDLIHWGDPR